MTARDPDSARANLSRLGLGESFSRATKLDLHVSGGDVAECIVQAIGTLRDSMQSAAHRAKQDNGRLAFTIETGKFFTRDNDVIVCVVATRVS